jgi:hypothetical protein
MTITVSWHNEEKTALVVAFDGPYDWDALRAAYRQAWAMIETQPHTVHLFNDSHKSPNMPGGGALGQYRAIAQSKPANLGITYVVGANSFGRMLSEVFVRALRRESRVRFAENIAEAEAMMLADESTAGSGGSVRVAASNEEKQTLSM